MRKNSAQPSRRAVPVFVLLTLVGAGCDKQNIGSNAESATDSGGPATSTGGPATSTGGPATSTGGLETGDPSTGSTDDIPDCGENFCPGNDCISRCEDDDSVDGCWYRCEPGEEVDCWGSCANDDDSDSGVPAFDPIPDVGDGSLAEDLLMVSNFGGQRLYVSLAAERLGDTFQGDARSASLMGGTWAFGPSQFIDASGAVTDNEITFRIDDYEFEAGHHPFGPGAMALDIVVAARIHTEEVLCGSITVQGDGVDATSIVTITPFDWTAKDGSQVIMCP